MISKIELKNIQSHKDTTIELDPGINIIVGSSNNGKSTIMRAINWVTYNRPLGIDTLASHWILDKKGNLKDTMSASIFTDDGYSVTRKRTKDENQYIINNGEEESELNVVKSDVPDEGTDILNLSDVSIQKQMDSPFLLSETNGEVAKYFNKLVRLDVIDKVLSNTESKKRKLKSDIEHDETTLKLKKKQHEEFNWFDCVEKLISRYERNSKLNDELKSQIETLVSEIDEYNNLQNIISEFSDISKGEKLIGKLEKENECAVTLQNEINNLNNEIIEYEDNSNFDYDFSISEKLIDKYNSVSLQNEKISDEIYDLKCSLDEFAEHSNNIITAENDIKKLKDKLPETCPYCGTKLIFNNHNELQQHPPNHL